jgi:hypothetical protein
VSQADVEALRERVAKGIEWLVAHDPTGAFHLWFTAHIPPNAPMPGQTPERIAEWREYHKQRTRWERMSSDLGRVDPTWAPA